MASRSRWFVLLVDYMSKWGAKKSWCFGVRYFAYFIWEASHLLQKTFIVSFSSQHYFSVLRVCVSCESIRVGLLWRWAKQINPPCLAFRQHLRNEKLFQSQYTLSICFYFLTTKSLCAPSHFKSNKHEKAVNFLNGLGLLWHLLRFRVGPAPSCRSAESPGRNCCFYC